MPDLEQQLEEAASPLERVKLIAELVERLVRTNINHAAELLDKTLPIARKLQRRGEARREYAMLLHANGWRHSNQGDFAKAEKAFQEALPLAAKLSDRSMVAYLLNGIGSIASSRAEYPRALKFFERASKMMNDLGDNAGIILCMNNIASATMGMGRLVEALEQFRTATALAEATEEPFGCSNALTGVR